MRTPPTHGPPAQSDQPENQNGSIDQHTARVGADYEPASSAALNRLAFSATVHCLIGCVLGEVTGLAIATALRWRDPRV
jgi:hypothetical protein